MGWYDYYPRYKRKAAKAVKGGIKAQGKVGVGQTWWAQRWIKTLESMGGEFSSRLGRGKTYARAGQVLEITIEKGLVKAQVQGSRPKPYEIEIALQKLSPAQWKLVAQRLSSQALYASKLLAGEMPGEIEALFTDAKAPLFPGQSKDLETDCSCPDYSNPCKHIAAVYYLMAQEFDRDPFLLLKLRGMEREEFLALIGVSAKPADEPAIQEPTEPLPTNLERFWSMPMADPGLAASPQVSASRAALLHRLGNFPLWRGREPLVTALEPLYQDASRAAPARLAGDPAGPQ